MNNQEYSGSIDLATQFEINDACDRFESSLQQGVRLEFEELLNEFDESIRPHVFGELVKVDLWYRTRDGENVPLDFYRNRYPEYADVLGDTLDETITIGQTNDQTELWENELPIRSNETRYRILHRHAKGGLGEVFVAKDEELNREVALKEIQSRFADDLNSRNRFLLEAEITGGLEHPGIVPVYGLGIYKDGRPYYAMRFIEGISLKEAIQLFHSDEINENERTLQFRKLLGKFVDVCQAISYAHSRGIIHRDLKPSNIMLGKYGETLVVDWGLAKICGRKEIGFPENSEETLRVSSGSSVNSTAFGDIIGTPAYMSPEQARGEVDILGPASDIFSLGATLFFLLTGTTPFQGKGTLEVIHALRKGNIPRARSGKSNVARELDAICAKAMSAEIENRYVSTSELAEDIERFLADESVSAMNDPVRVKVRRWVRKHPAIVTSTAAAVLIGLFSLAISNSLISQVNSKLKIANRDLDNSNRLLDEKNTELEAAIQNETTAKNLAIKNESAAREQSQLALSTLNSVVFDIHESLKNVSGASEARRQLLSTSIEKLSEVANEFVSESAVDRNTASAFLEMGDLVLKFGTGIDSVERREEGEEIDLIEGDESNVPDQQRSAVQIALQFYRQSLEIGQRIVEADPDNLEDQLFVSECYENIGDALVQSGRLNETLENYQICLEIRNRIVATSPDHYFAKYELAVAREKMGNFLLRSGDAAGSLEQHLLGLQLLKELYASGVNNDSSLQRSLVVLHHKAANVMVKLGRNSEAIALYKKGVAFRDNLAAEPNDIESQLNISDSRIKIGNMLKRLERYEEAIEQYELSVEICNKLYEQDSNDILAQRDLGRRTQ